MRSSSKPTRVILVDNHPIVRSGIRAELEKLQSEGELAWKDLKSLTSGPYLRTIPGVHPCDGFFAAILEKKV